MLHTDINTYIYFVHFSVHLSLFVFAAFKIVHFCYRAQFTWRTLRYFEELLAKGSYEKPPGHYIYKQDKFSNSFLYNHARTMQYFKTARITGQYKTGSTSIELL